MSEGIVLSEAFVKNILPGLRDDYLKIYIYTKYLTERGKADNKEIASVLRIEESTVAGAIGFFSELGLLKESGGKIEFKSEESEEDDAMPEYNAEKVLDIIAESDEFQTLLVTTQKILGKMPSTNSTIILYGLYDWLSMSPELIIRLLEYCVELGKREWRYIEKVAISWNKMGITTCEMADDYIMRQQKKSKFGYGLKRIFGIEQRNYTPTEQKYIDSWYDLGFSMALVEYAFDYCVSKTGKLAFPYMNTVLIAWNEKGIKTPQQAKASVERYNLENKFTKKGRPKKEAKSYEIYDSGRYDFNKIEENARKKIVESLKSGNS